MSMIDSLSGSQVGWGRGRSSSLHTGCSSQRKDRLLNRKRGHLPMGRPRQNRDSFLNRGQGQHLGCLGPPPQNLTHQDSEGSKPLIHQSQWSEARSGPPSAAPVRPPR